MIDITEENESIRRIQAKKVELWQEAIDTWKEMLGKSGKLDKLDGIERAFQNLPKRIVKVLKEEKII